MKKHILQTIVVAMLLVSICLIASAQTTEFTYQGSLQNAGSAANGNYDFEFLLFDAVSGGTQIGTTVTQTSVAVANGTFAVKLNFGGVFPGASRFLEVRVKPTGGGAYTVLNPRQSVTSSPYAVMSLNAVNAVNAQAATTATTATTAINATNATNAVNATNATTATTATNATQLGGVAANQFVQTGDTRLTDDRNPLPNSTNYIQNTTSPQATSNFNVSGNGTAGGTLSGNIVNATTQYDIGGDRVLAVRGNNLTVGSSAGFAITTGGSNAFFGQAAGQRTTTGGSNSFFGQAAGQTNTSGVTNSFFGAFTGRSNTFGFANAFFGYNSGSLNTTGNDNSFFGYEAGRDNTSGFRNSSFGRDAGNANTTGVHNSFFGFAAGNSKILGSNNSYFGANSDSTDGLRNATAIGNRAYVTQDNSLVLGSISGINDCTATLDCSSVNVGIGTTAPLKKLHVAGTSDQEVMIESTDVGGIKWSFQSSRGSATGRLEIIDRTNNVSRVSILANGSMGIGTTTPNDKLDVNGTIGVAFLGAAGATPLCRNTTNQISTCSSSIRYKNNIQDFRPGLNLVRKLRPVTFNWKADNKEDMGLVAEEVNAAEPLLTTTNDKGEIEGVKYDRVGVVLVNAVNEQQDQIESQAKEINEQKTENEAQQKQIDEQKLLIKKQQAEIDALKQLVCSQNPTAAICKPKE
jgi:Chaperone of endosialidase